jgi:D-arabinose 1-dehydrogenase-like Zn-dependent alcohol dehydrogenase
LYIIEGASFSFHFPAASSAANEEIKKAKAVYSVFIWNQLRALYRILSGAIQYIDSQSQNPIEELVKLGGAKIILATVPSGKVMSAVLGGLAVDGKPIMIGASDEPLEVSPNFFLSGRRSVVGWPSGSSIDSQDTLSFSLLSGVRSMNEIFPLERAAEAYELMMSGKVRFRAVLTTGNQNDQTL